MNKRALLDTNILIHREARTVIRDDIGTLFRWLNITNTCDDRWKLERHGV